MRSFLFVRLTIFLGIGLFALPVFAQWAQWGGPTRDFRAPTDGLTTDWPEDGLPAQWNRDLGEGYSGISVHGDFLFTMYREGDEEVIIALSRADGKTAWEHRFKAPMLAGMRDNHGIGPHVTPLVAGERLFAIGGTGKLFALNSKTGAELWKHDLLEDFSGSFLHRGYGSSPIAFRDWVIVQVGGKGNALMAFSQSDGSVVWRGQDFGNSPSSPIIIEVGGRQQLVAFMANDIVGVNPNNGQFLWSHSHPSSRYFNISTPVWGEDNLLFMSSAYDGGSRVIELMPEDETTEVRQRWHTPRMYVHFTNAIRRGDYIYGSSGDFGPVFLTAVNVKTGEFAWRKRDIGRANLIDLGDEVLALEDDGTLSLIRLSPDELEILASTQLFDSKTWTIPTLVGKTLYARDQENILAVQLPGQ